MTDRLQTCRSCQYFEYLPGKEADKESPGALGECHRNAPESYLLPSGQSINGSNQVVVWPQLPDTEWCGEYERRQEAW